jgi:hypothetical protein
MGGRPGDSHDHDIDRGRDMCAAKASVALDGLVGLTRDRIDGDVEERQPKGKQARELQFSPPDHRLTVTEHRALVKQTKPTSSQLFVRTSFKDKTPRPMV